MPTPTDLPRWISPAQYRALARVIAAIEGMAVPYQVSGGLAGNLHGSRWPVEDIDLDVPSDALAALADLFRTWPGAAVQGPSRYRDDEFELDLLEITLEGVEFDISGADDAVVRTPGGARHALAIDLPASVIRPLGALALRVLPLEELLRYKRLLGRRADLADLERLA